MPEKQITIPKFRSKGKEAEWWESREGKRTATELMKRAAGAGAVKRRKLPLSRP